MRTAGVLSNASGGGERGDRKGELRAKPVAWLLAAALLIPSAVHGALITVDTTSDVDAVDGFCSLREAILAAENDAPYNECDGGDDNDDRINFGSDANLILLSPLPTITESLRILGPGPNLDLFGGDGIRAFTIDAGGTGDVVVLDNFAIGLANADAIGGGAVLAENVTLRLTNMTFSFCTVDGFGSGGAVLVLQGDLEVESSRFSFNSTGENGIGGAIAISGGALSIIDSEFENNGGTGSSTAGGGAVSASQLSSLHLERSRFVGNDAESGGGGMTAGFSAASTATITGNFFSLNTVTGGGGLGVEPGGGLAISGPVTALLEANTFDRNSAEGGGALSLTDNTGAPTVTVRNTTFDNNGASLEGQAIAVFSGSVLLDHATISDHGDAPTVLATRAGASISISNSVFWNPDPTTICGGAGTISTLGYNLFRDAGCGNGPNDLIGLNPLLEPLSDNGGAVPTRSPGNGSPAIDSGSPVSRRARPGDLPVERTGETVVCHLTDARGVARPQDGDDNGSSICDRGAVEQIAAEIFSDGFESGSTTAWN